LFSCSLIPRLSSPLLTFLSFLFPLPRPPSSTLFPYTTLFRSLLDHRLLEVDLDLRRLGEGGAAAAKVGLLRVALAGLAHLVGDRSEEHTSELQSRENLVCRLLLEKKKKVRLPSLLGRRAQDAQ